MDTYETEGRFYERVAGLREEAFDLIDEVRQAVLSEPRLLHELQTVANRLGTAEDLTTRRAA